MHQVHIWKKIFVAILLVRKGCLETKTHTAIDSASPHLTESKKQMRVPFSHHIPAYALEGELVVGLHSRKSRRSHGLGSEREPPWSAGPDLTSGTAVPSHRPPPLRAPGMTGSHRKEMRSAFYPFSKNSFEEF